jgi:siroheme synthase-like protein
MPGIVQRGDLVIAISTSGRSPAMARKMREELSDFLTEEWVAMLELAAEVRAGLRERDIMVDSDTWNAALDNELRHLLKEGRYDEARQRLLRNLQQPVSGT